MNDLTHLLGDAAVAGTSDLPIGAASGSAGPSELSFVLVNLMKGPLYRDSQERLFDSLLRLHGRVADHVAVIGLEVRIDESEGYAYLRSRPSQDDNDDFPRLVARRSLSFHVSLLLALLRKRLAEFDAANSDTRLTLSRDQIVEMMRLYFPDLSNEARLVDIIVRQINRAVELGFLRKMEGGDDLFEVRRILKAYVDGEWLAEFDARLDEYVAALARTGANEGLDE
jgi:hypothetical protein